MVVDYLCVFSRFFKVLMILADQVKTDNSFHFIGTEKVKVLESNFVLRCEEANKNLFKIPQNAFYFLENQLCTCPLKSPELNNNVTLTINNRALCCT